jgi:hypothetical protein
MMIGPNRVGCLLSKDRLRGLFSPKGRNKRTLVIARGTMKHILLSGNHLRDRGSEKKDIRSMPGQT